jgi:hypothetical protein
MDNWIKALPIQGMPSKIHLHCSVGLNAIALCEAEAAFPMKSVEFQQEGVVARIT